VNRRPGGTSSTQTSNKDLVEQSLAAPNEKLKQKQKSARDLETKAAQEKNCYTTIRAVRTKSLDETTIATQETSRHEKSTNKMQVLIFPLDGTKISHQCHRLPSLI
jgi:hypothetical protein